MIVSFSSVRCCRYLFLPSPSAVFVARTSWMFRAMGSLLDEQIQTAKRWSKHARAALNLESCAM